MEAAQRMIRACAVAATCAALWAPSAGAHAPAARLAAAPVSCAGAADASLQPHRVITGEFDTSLERGYVMLPFDVPAGDGGAGALLPRSAGGAHECGSGTCSTSGCGTRARRRACSGPTAVPRLGGLQPPRRDAVAERILERGGLPPRESGCTARATRRAAFAPARSQPGNGPWSWEWRRSPRRPRDSDGRGRVARRGRHLERPFVGAARPPRRPTTRRRQAGRPGGTRATSTSMPSTHRWGTPR